ncbi:MAG: protein kinase family protein [Endozoicomonadaceae bacterium]|nr:protein kinase family protein [Endozoicomonadaceae bacterium]
MDKVNKVPHTRKRTVNLSEGAQVRSNKKPKFAGSHCTSISKPVKTRVPPAHTQPELTQHQEKKSVIFKVSRLITQGGFSAVFNVTEANSDKPDEIILKIADRQYTQREGACIEWQASKIEDPHCSCQIMASHNEAYIHRQMKHENIISFIGFGHVNGNPDASKKIPTILMEACEMSLRNKIEKLCFFKNYYVPGAPHPLPLNKRCKILYDTVNGLKYLHSQHCMHLDIHPKNIVLSRAGQAKLCDFGLSCWDSFPEKSGITFDTWSASLTYMAPENYLKFAGISTQADIFGIGVTIKMSVLGTLGSHGWWTEKSLFNNIYTADYKLKEPVKGKKLFGPFDVLTAQEMILQSNDPEFNSSPHSKEIAIRILKEIAVPCLRVMPYNRPCASDILIRLKEIQGDLQRTQ